MASYDRIEDALERMQKTSTSLAALPFRNTSSFSRAVLEPQLLLSLIREAESHELALFQQAKEGGATAFVAEQLERLRLGRSGSGRWEVPKRVGPLRRSAPDHPSPLKRRAVEQDDPERYLQAAAKLLSVYHLPRAKEHVDQLLAEYDHVVDSIADLEAEAATPSTGAADDLQAAIQREELEILALQDAEADLRKRLKAATTKVKRKVSNRTVRPVEAVVHDPEPEVVAPLQSSRPAEVVPPIVEPETPPSPEPLPAPPALVEDVPPELAMLPTAPPLSSHSDNDAISRLCWQRLSLSLSAFAADAPSEPSTSSLRPFLDQLSSDASIPTKDRSECALVSLILTALSLPLGAEPLRALAVEPAVKTGAVPMFPMSTLKTAMARWAREAGGIEVEALETLPTKAIYALVAKRLLAIDRRSKDAMVYFLQ